jgi:hypothetical protein
MLSLLEILTSSITCGDLPHLIQDRLSRGTVGESIGHLLKTLWIHHRDAECGLLFNQGGFDAFEAQNAQNPADSRNAHSFLNLYAYKTLDQLIPYLGPDLQSIWKPRIQELRTAILGQLVDLQEPRLHGAVAIDPDSPFAHTDWQPLLPISLSLLLSTNLLEPEHKAAFGRQLQAHLQSQPSDTLGMAMTPPPPPGLTSPYIFMNCTHVGGSNSTQLCSRAAQWLQEADIPDLAGDLLCRLAERAVADGGFYPWYTPDNCPQGAHPHPLPARAFINALTDIFPHKLPFPGRMPAKEHSTDPIRKTDFFHSDHHARMHLREVPVDEKRTSRRLPLELKGHIRFGGRFSAHTEQNAAIRFPSTTGLTIQSSNVIPVGTKVKLTLDLRSRGGASSSCTLKGHVVWTHEKLYHLLSQCGVELDHKADIGVWKDFILQKMDQSHKAAPPKVHVSR